MVTKGQVTLLLQINQLIDNCLSQWLMNQGSGLKHPGIYSEFFDIQVTLGKWLN